MRSDMIAGLRGWARSAAGGPRHRRTHDRQHDGWSVEARRAPLGVVGFVFEGRPNVFADAAGVVRTGNTVVFRIGSDALGTAEAIVEHALDPALALAGLPEGTVRPRGVGGACRRMGAVLRLRGCRWPSRVARVRPSRSSARSPDRPAFRSACTAPGERGWSPPPMPTPTGSRGRSAFARPQGVQHAERVLHRSATGRRAGPGLPRSGHGCCPAARCRRPCARHWARRWSSCRWRNRVGAPRSCRADGAHDEPFVSPISHRRARPRMGMGGVARGDASTSSTRSTTRSCCAIDTARGSWHR